MKANEKKQALEKKMREAGWSILFIGTFTESWVRGNQSFTWGRNTTEEQVIEAINRDPEAIC